MFNGYKLTQLNTINEDLRESLEVRLDVHNARLLPDFFDDFRGGAKNRQPLDLYLQDESGELMAGLIGVTYWDTLYIDTLWVAEVLRGQGMGKSLMQTVEAQAKSRQCTFGWLRTFSFQARGFYERLGYEVFGQLDNHPPGHTYYFMRKTFS